VQQSSASKHNKIENFSEHKEEEAFKDSDFVAASVEEINRLILDDSDDDCELNPSRDDFNSKQKLLLIFETATEESDILPAFSLFMLSCLSTQQDDENIQKCVKELYQEGKLEQFSIFDELFLEIKILNGYRFASTCN